MKLKTFLFMYCLILWCGCTNTGTGSTSRNHIDCSTPISKTCDSLPCGFAEIYSSDGILLREFDPTPFHDGEWYFFWDGLDFNGDTTPCGEYTAKHSVFYKDSIVTKCYSVIFGHSQYSVSSNGRSSCDSLRNECTGNYYEAPGMVWAEDGTLQNTITCLCCK